MSGCNQSLWNLVVVDIDNKAKRRREGDVDVDQKLEKQSDQKPEENQSGSGSQPAESTKDAEVLDEIAKDYNKKVVTNQQLLKLKDRIQQQSSKGV